MARHHHASHGSRGGRKRHPLLVAGAVVGTVALAYLLFEKKASASTSGSTTNVNGATLPSGAGNNLPTGGGPSVNTGDSSTNGSDGAAGSDSNDPTGGLLTN